MADRKPDDDVIPMRNYHFKGVKGEFAQTTENLVTLGYGIYENGGEFGELCAIPRM